MHWCALFVKMPVFRDVVGTQSTYKHGTAGVFSSLRVTRGFITKQKFLQAINEDVKAVCMT